MEAQRLSRWSRDVRGGVFAGLKFLVARVTCFGNPLPWAKAAATWNPPGLMRSGGTTTAGCGGLLASPRDFREGNKIKWVQKKRKVIRSIRYFQALITWFFFPHHHRVPSAKGRGGYLVPGLNRWVMGKREVCVRLEGGERRRARGGEREIQGSGHLPRKITNILQERNPKTEIIVWKKSVSQTLEPEYRPRFFMCFFFSFFLNAGILLTFEH